MELGKCLVLQENFSHLSLQRRAKIAGKNTTERRLGFGAAIVVVPSIFGTAADRVVDLMKKGLRPGSVTYGSKIASTDRVVDLMKKGLRQNRQLIHSQSGSDDRVVDLMKKGLRPYVLGFQTSRQMGEIELLT